MGLITTYGLWNNKGGVGKSTITYHLATRYAEKKPNLNVLVIDLCPQANSSMMLLGGGQVGEQHAINFCAQATPRTVVGYLTTVITNGQGAALPNPNNFSTQVHQYNPNLPENLFLLCGDGNLEPISPAISNQANAMPLVQGSNPWIWIHNIFRDYIQNFAALNSEKDLLVFIDTNPAFGIYTELAVTAMDKLLCPVNADDSSRTAANAMTLLLHGSQPPHPIYGSWTFAASAQRNGINIPKIHMMIGNRLTQFEGAATAFNALSEASANTLYTIYTHSPHYFTGRAAQINTIDDFKDNYSVPLRDFNTAGVVTAHLGRLLSKMKEGYYPVYGVNVKINKAKVTECLTAVDLVIASL